MPAMPDGVEEGICRGLYRFRSVEAQNAKHRVQLFGSGAIMQCVLKAQQLLADRFGISSDVWSVTSYTQLARESHEAARWNRLHPDARERRSGWLEQSLSGVEGPFIAASDYVRAYMEQIREYMPGDYLVLGTDGLGRSDTRDTLRRHFEVDAESIAVAAFDQLARQGKVEKSEVARAIKELDYDPEKEFPLYA
jgi:pyruvate dehydrogenase E1 component